MKRREAILLEAKLNEIDLKILEKFEIELNRHRDIPDEWCVVIW